MISQKKIAGIQDFSDEVLIGGLRILSDTLDRVGMPTNGQYIIELINRYQDQQHD